ncbi:Hypothetical protein CAP_8964 [Chondromyces apiculatus DSM 436]|uniref:Uncharacterized protein n=1 Tax=Chondromyces apiculatus DSM 436 TaxID=1192034 RepID=A0A017SW79_9BACT|nr:Hypothetical protein CAP_8964 [Chondromyces apiculatus DSM 436]
MNAAPGTSVFGRVIDVSPSAWRRRGSARTPAVCRSQHLRPSRLLGLDRVLAPSDDVRSVDRVLAGVFWKRGGAGGSDALAPVIQLRF